MLLESVLIAWQSLVANKMRALLTMLGIIIGVGAVIAMVSIGLGMREQITNSISNLGSNMLTISPGSRSSSGVRLTAGQGNRLTLSDVTALKREVPGIKLITGSVSRSFQLIFGNQNWTSNITGTTAEYQQIRQLKLQEGRFIEAGDNEAQAKVCVIGQTVADNLFLGGDPLGKIVRINAKPFKVIGLLESKGAGAGGADQDDVVIIPLSTAMQRMLGITYLNSILIEVDNKDVINSVQDSITQILSSRHHLHVNEDDDFNVRNFVELLNTIDSNLATITAFLGCIAGISLLVGGIGIMNIMLVSVTERTREIGIRKALGATYSNILLQFLIESVVISITGGFIGIILGSAISIAVSLYLAWSSMISVSAIVVALVFSVAIGVFFGLYPARKAALLDPIDALRYE